MKGDFSRNTFDKAKHFSRVLMQQGRVQLDADWNEQAAILLHYLRTLTADLIGPFAGPTGTDGFEIKMHGTNDLSISQGRYYVDGILCENDKPSVIYSNQDDFPKAPSLDPGKSYLVYLDVWEYHITALEDDNIREKALGGPDTASRAQVVWQVKLKDATDAKNIPTALVREEVLKGWGEWIRLWQPPRRGCLKARVKRPEDSHDPCLNAPDAKYRGAENQLYHIEIHRPGRNATEAEVTAWRKGQTSLPDEVATFKWSRDNGAIVTRCELNGKELTALNSRGFAANQWVELTNDEQELRGMPGSLAKVTKVEDNQLILEQAVSKPVDAGDEDWPSKVRRWDQSERGALKLLNGAAPVKEGTTEADWIELEDGIQIQFSPAGATLQHHYRTGDYWLIPARVATGNIEWSVELENSGKPKLDASGNTIPIPKSPHGIRHHYAPLAILSAGGADGWNPEDCRCKFPPHNDCTILSHGEEGFGGEPICGFDKAWPSFFVGSCQRRELSYKEAPWCGVT